MKQQSSSSKTKSVSRLKQRSSTLSTAKALTKPKTPLKKRSGLVSSNKKGTTTPSKTRRSPTAEVKQKHGLGWKSGLKKSEHSSSVSKKMGEWNKEYKKELKRERTFLFSLCPWCGTTSFTSRMEPHHPSGRNTLKKLLFFVFVHPHCHIDLHNNPRFARSGGLLT